MNVLKNRIKNPKSSKEQESQMKKLFVLIIVIFFFTTVNAQSPKVTEVKKFLVSGIIVKAPDIEDSTFVAAAIREELIRAGKIDITKGGDVLQVKLIVEFGKDKQSYSVYNGRNGKYGEVSLAIISKNGSAAATSRDYVSSFQGSSYYLILQNLAKEAANKFQYIK